MAGAVSARRTRVADAAMQEAPAAAARTGRSVSATMPPRDLIVRSVCITLHDTTHLSSGRRRVDFGHDTLCALGTVVALVNSAPDALARRRACRPRRPAALVERQDISEVGPLTHDDLAPMRRLRARLARSSRPRTTTAVPWSTP